MRLFGKNPVLERLRGNPQSVRKIYLQQDFRDAGPIRKKAKQLNIPVFVIPKSRMLKIGRSAHTQGILADVEDFVYTPYEDLLENAYKKKKCLVFLDGLKDPQNLGAMFRSLACLANFCMILPTHDSVGVTEAVLRVASGGESYVPVARVANLRNAIKTAKNKNYQMFGTEVNTGQSLYETQFPALVGLVVGSEQKGIRDVIRKELDHQITIPMPLERLSFNVASATTLFCYEITKQKNQRKKK